MFQHVLPNGLKKSMLIVTCILTNYAIFSQVEPDTLTIKIDSVERVQETRLPVFNQSEDDNDDMGSQDIAGLLQSSRDVFTATAGFSFGPARFRIRGYGGENTTVLINGIRMNEMETGRAMWNGWAGLNDVTRYMDVKSGLHPSREIFAGIGGFSSINARASSLRPGTRVSYAGTNRNYHHRVMMTHSTGLMENGWAFSASASRRWAQEGYVDGTWFDAWSYFLAIEKKINKKHSIGLVGFGASQQQGLQAMVVQEAYDLTGSNYYNPNWGYQDGEKRNSRVRNTHKPTGILTHYWQITKTLQLNTSLYVNGGRGGTTRLNWYDAKDPRPEYYRYLPSYQEPGSELFNQVTSNWQNNVSTQQIDWDHLYNANRKNLYTVVNANGSGADVTGMRSKYIVEEIRTDHVQYGYNSIVEKRFGDKTVLTGGYTASFYTGKNFRVVNDLLGGDFWVDVDQFSERDFDDPDVAQNDIDTPNKLVYEGDRYGYDYDNRLNRHDVFAQLEHEFGRVSTYLSSTYSYTEFWRVGNMVNGRFPDNSGGASEKQKFHNAGVKAGAVFKISGRQYASLNGGALTRAPQMRNAYISPRTRNDVVSNLENEEIYSADVNYMLRFPKLKLRLTYYYTEVKNQTWMRSFYHDEYRNFVNYIMTGVDNRHNGVELGVEWKITSTISATGVFAHGKSIYSSRPSATISRDNNSELIDENRTVYLKNYRMGGMPQTAAAIGMRYNSPKYWFIGFNVNYFDHIYLDPNPDRRTAEAVEGYVTSDPQWSQIIDQERLDPGFTVDLYGGKSFRIKKLGHFINLNVSISNLLNNRNFRVGGFEQLRYTPSNIDRFPPMYSYMFGITFFGMVSYSF
jgi:hypothetical protein